MNNKIDIEKIRKLREESRLGYKQIGEIFGVSRQRIHQIYKGYSGVNSKKMNKIKENKSCAFCSSVVKLHVHHIDKDRKNNDAKNLLVLCFNCHAGVHRGEKKDSVKIKKDHKPNNTKASKKWMSNPQNRKKHSEWVKRYKAQIVYRAKEYKRIIKLKKKNEITDKQFVSLILAVE